MTGAFDREWEHLLESTRATPLAVALANSSLRRFHPFASHNFVRFGTSPDRRHGRIAPASVSAYRFPDRYIVWAGPMFAEDLRSVLRTPSPARAVAALEQLLRDWPPDSDDGGPGDVGGAEDPG